MPSTNKSQKLWMRGEAVEYYSRSNKQWMPTKVIAQRFMLGEIEANGFICNPTSEIQVDIKPGHWISAEEQKTIVHAPIRRKQQEAERSQHQCTVKGQNYDTRSCYERALELDPSYSDAWHNLGVVGGGKVKGQTYDVRSCCERALELDPSYVNSWHNLGVAGGGKVKGQNYDERSCYERALELDASCARVWRKLGVVGGGRVKGQSYDERSCYERALELDPSGAKAWHNLGAVGGGKVKGHNHDERSCHQRC